MNVLIVIVIISVISILTGVILYYINKEYNKYINLTVFCSARDGISDEYKSITKSLINMIDNKKFRIIYGGNNGGLMSVISDTWKGDIISVNFKKFKTSNDNYMYNNIYDRQRKLIELGNIYLVLPGGAGTLSELMDVILFNEVSEDKDKKDIIIFNYNGIYDDLLKYFDDLKSKKFIDDNFIQDRRIKVYTKVKDIVQYLNGKF
jgi:uncharacterized protein (TIGR00730 family)